MAKGKKLRVIPSNAPLRDAPRDLVLHITPADIKGAKRGDNSDCAAAHALCRQEKNVRRAIIHKTKSYVEMRNGQWWRYITPQSLYVELMIFDRKGEMQGGDFVLSAPKGVQKLGAHYKPKGPHLTTGKAKRPMHVVANVRDNAPKGPGLFRSLAGA